VQKLFLEKVMNQLHLLFVRNQLLRLLYIRTHKAVVVEQMMNQRRKPIRARQRLLIHQALLQRLRIVTSQSLLHRKPMLVN